MPNGIWLCVDVQRQRKLLLSPIGVLAGWMLWLFKASEDAAVDWDQDWGRPSRDVQVFVACSARPFWRRNSQKSFPSSADDGDTLFFKGNDLWQHGYDVTGPDGGAVGCWLQTLLGYWWAEADMLIRRITSQKRTAAPVKTPSIRLRLSGRSNSKREIPFSWR